MIEDIYCYKLKKKVTLLTTEEFAPIGEALANRMEQITAYRKTHNVSIDEARANTSKSALDLYENLTGVKLEHPEELYVVLQDLYGRQCPSCTKPFRTPRAKLCAECGYVLPKGEVAGPICDPQ